MHRAVPSPAGAMQKGQRLGSTPTARAATVSHGITVLKVMRVRNSLPGKSDQLHWCLVVARSLWPHFPTFTFRKPK